MELGIPHTNPILQQLYYNVNASMLPKGIVLCVCVQMGQKKSPLGGIKYTTIFDPWQGWTAYVCEPIVTGLRSVRPDLKEGLICE